MFSTTRKFQRGFSLVELMVVVAIIGVLASIAVPAINKYLAKARQSEAKTNLASLYTSEKAFYAEYTAYDTRFDAVGYSPEGKLRYNIGFSDNHFNAGAAHGYTGGGTNTLFNTVAYCGTGGTINTRGCASLNGATGSAPGAITGSSASATAFVAGAFAVIHSAVSAGDRWTIDNNKALTNTANGIP